MRGGAQGKGSMQKGATGSGDEEFNAQPGTSGERAATGTKSKGTVGSSGAHKGSGGMAADPTSGSKR